MLLKQRPRVSKKPNLIYDHEQEDSVVIVSARDSSEKREGRDKQMIESPLQNKGHFKKWKSNELQQH